MPILRVHHVTTYTYRRSVGFGQHRLLFRPRDSFDQRLISTSLKVFPEPSDLFWIHDVFGNCVAVAEFDAPSDSLRFERISSLTIIRRSVRISGLMRTPGFGPSSTMPRKCRTLPPLFNASFPTTG